MRSSSSTHLEWRVDYRPHLSEFDQEIVEEIQHKAELYAATPGIGQRHPDLPEGWERSIHLARQTGNPDRTGHGRSFFSGVVQR